MPRFLTLRAAPALLYVWLLLLASPLGAAPAGSDASLRLGFLFNFGKFTSWPSTELADKDAPVHICLASGDAAMVKALGALEAGTLAGHRVETRLLTPQADAVGCHLLYLPGTLSAEELDGYLKKVAEQPTLTVSDRSGFVRRGGMIELVYADARYQFDVNYLAVKRVNLRLSSSMLRLARNVE